MEFFGKLILIVGPSGSGKGTVIAEIKRRYPGFVYPVSYTTREMREGEIEGQVYHFVSRAKFEQMIENGEFLEYAQVHSNNYYGTAKEEVLKPAQEGAVVVREVDIQGFHSIRELVPAEHLLSIFMLVKDEDDLRGRILHRGVMTDEELERRMDSARKEIAQAGDCNYQVENERGNPRGAINAVEKIILAEIKDLY